MKIRSMLFIILRALLINTQAQQKKELSAAVIQKLYDEVKTTYKYGW
ncbi:MAG: hypothetical protein ABI707_04280 [Ferruginibacter sp.]